MQNAKFLKATALVCISIFIQACEEDFFYEPPPPHVPGPTTSLEAQYVTAAPTTINSAYWKSADYLPVHAVNVSTGLVFTDGLLNMTGSYNGMSSFNNGTSPNLTLKAAYDDTKLYVLAEWTDSDVNLSQGSWLYNGPTDPLKSDAANGWTSQRNSDKFSLAFEIQAASTAAGTFSNVGCAASCHGSGASAVMYPDAGKVDFWNWDLAHSAPMGYALDMVADQNAFTDDAGSKMYERNVNGATDRSGPAWEWNGVSQSVTLPSGQSSILDPSFYLFNKTPFLGNAANGDSLYHSDVPGQPGHCHTCHGDKGEGGSASLINTISMNKKSRVTLMQNMDNVPDMTAYWNNNLSQSQKDDIIAYLRGLSGVPGYYLAQPSGSNADITAVSNVTPQQIVGAALPATNVHTKYQVLLVRKLKTNNADDAQFDLAASRSYKFGVAMMDDDGRNHIGSVVETLTFK